MSASVLAIPVCQECGFENDLEHMVEQDRENARQRCLRCRTPYGSIRCKEHDAIATRTQRAWGEYECSAGHILQKLD